MGVQSFNSKAASDKHDGPMKMKNSSTIAVVIAVKLSYAIGHGPWDVDTPYFGLCAEAPPERGTFSGFRY